MEQFSNGEYKLVEDVIVKEKDKKSLIIKLNVYALIIVGIGVVLTLVLFSIIGITKFTFNPLGTGLFLVSFLVFIVVHELLHGLSFILFNRSKLSDVKFGIVLKSGMAYCISTVPVKVDAARLSLMMPVYVVCIPLYIVGVVIGNMYLCLLAILFFSGSAGDLYYMWKLRNTNKNHYMFEKMPTKSGYEVGYLLYEKLESN